jgi:hypothetical protein
MTSLNTRWTVDIALLSNHPPCDAPSFSTAALIAAADRKKEAFFNAAFAFADERAHKFAHVCSYLHNYHFYSALMLVGSNNINLYVGTKTKAKITELSLQG